MINFIAMISPIFKIPQLRSYQSLEKQLKGQMSKKINERKKLSPHRNYLTYNKEMKLKEGLDNSSFDIYK